MATTIKTPCLLDLSAHSTRRGRSGGYVTSYEIYGRPCPELRFEVRRPADICVLVERFGAALRCLYPEASFKVSGRHIKAINRVLQGRKVSGFDAALDEAERPMPYVCKTEKDVLGDDGDIWANPALVTAHADPEVNALADKIRTMITEARARYDAEKRHHAA